MNVNSIGNKIIVDYFRFAAAGLVAIIFVLGYVVLISGQIDELRTSGYLERARVESNLTAKRAQLAALNDSIAKFDRVLPADKLETIDAFLPTGTDFPGLLLTIQDVAKAANLDLEALSVGVVAGSDTVAVAPTTDAGAVAQAATIPGVNIQAQDVSIAVSQGRSYESFKRFVALLESSQRLFDVVAVSFDHPALTAEDSGDGTTYSVTVRTYYLPVTP